MIVRFFTDCGSSARTGRLRLSVWDSGSCPPRESPRPGLDEESGRGSG
ncbi:hypothetical protein [Streptomyces bluensis]